MIYLFASILCSGSLGIFFKFFEKRNLSSQSAIFFNYLTCLVIGIGLNFRSLQSIQYENWMIYTFLLGLIFIVTLALMAKATRKSGITSMVVSNKMSLVLPVCFGLLVLKEPVHWITFLGIGLCLTSLLMVTYRKESHKNKIMFWLLFGVFLLSGTIDIGIAFLEDKYFGESSNFMIPTLFIFGSAVFWGIPNTIKTWHSNKETRKANIFWGILLGFPNFFSIFFLFKCLHDAPFPSSVVFPINNMGVIFIGFLASLAFKEKLNKINYLGVLLALCAIAILSLSKSSV